MNGMREIKYIRKLTDTKGAVPTKLLFEKTHINLFRESPWHDAADWDLDQVSMENSM